MIERRSQGLCRALLLASWALSAPPGYGEDGSAAVQDEAGEIDVKGATLGRMGEPIGVDPEEHEFAQAEARLWLDDHLQNIERPGRLYYDFIKRGSYEEGFNDSIYLDIIEVREDGGKDANLEFFTGERRQQAGADNLLNITGNPVLAVYLQGDVYEMNRLTGGSWRYFQRRIKFAFSNGAGIEPVTFDYAGAKLSGEKISIAPYIDDPRRKQFARFAPKAYEFILSDQVPGKLYQIKTVVPGESPEDGPLIEEILTLQHTEFQD